MLFPTKMLHHYPEFSQDVSTTVPWNLVGSWLKHELHLLMFWKQSPKPEAKMLPSPLERLCPERGCSRSSYSKPGGSWSSCMCPKSSQTSFLHPWGVQGWEMSAWNPKLGSHAGQLLILGVFPAIPKLAVSCCVWLPTGGIVERFGLKKTLKTLKMLVLCLGWQRKLSVLLVKLKELGCGSGETKKEGEKAKKGGRKGKKKREKRQNYFLVAIQKEKAMLNLTCSAELVPSAPSALSHIPDIPLSSAVAKETKILLLTRGELLRSPAATHPNPSGCLEPQPGSWARGACRSSVQPAWFGFFVRQSTNNICSRGRAGTEIEAAANPAGCCCAVII